MNKFSKIGLGFLAFVLLIASMASTASAIEAKKIKYRVETFTPPAGGCAVIASWSGANSNGGGGNNEEVVYRGTLDSNGVCRPGVATNQNPEVGAGSNDNSVFDDLLLPKIGDKKKENVRQMQFVLKNDGFLKVVDGNFGPGTKTALMKFQLKNNLPATGIFNPETKALMITKLKTINNAGAPSPVPMQAASN